MFCSPKDTGNMGTNFVFFGAEIDLGIEEPPYLYEHWLKRFEKLIKKLRAHEAFVLVEYSHFDVFAVGYCLGDEKYIKEKINLYKLLADKADIDEKCLDPTKMNHFRFPLIFTILKILMKKYPKLKEEVSEFRDVSDLQ